MRKNENNSFLSLWVPDQEVLSELQYHDRIHINTWCICCSRCFKQSSWSGHCMSGPSPLHRLATQHFDERDKCKRNESFLSQPEHTIWVSNYRTLKTQYLHLGVFLWKQYIWFLQVTKTFARCKDFDYVLLYSHYSISFQALIYWNCHLHKRFITRWSVSVVIVFPFLGAGFANIPPTYLISCEVQTRYSKILKYSEQYIRDRLPGTT